MLVRPARQADYALFARLFRELHVPDEIPTEARFAREMMPTTRVAERGGAPVGVAYHEILRGVGFLRVLVTDPDARRSGVGRALMADLRDRFRAAGLREWCLNVLPDNAAAIALYESFGLRERHRSRAVTFPWAALGGRTPPEDARPIRPEDDAAVESELGILPGLLGQWRAKEGRVLLMIERPDGTAAAAVFDPAFPGAYPFRARTGEDALALLAALRPHARPKDPALAIASEHQTWIADALLAAGATLRMETMHMRGPL